MLLKKEAKEEAAKRSQPSTSTPTATKVTPKSPPRYALSGPIITRGGHQFHRYVSNDSNVFPQEPLESKDKNYDYLLLYKDFKEINRDDESTHSPVNVLLTEHRAISQRMGISRLSVTAVGKQRKC
ncbi:hypothetical protein MMC20_006019 [Loxospora ochrophaea]|nr:hypothetical protein [Loxospora ochrophaea]